MSLFSKKVECSFKTWDSLVHFLSRAHALWPRPQVWVFGQGDCSRSINFACKPKWIIFELILLSESVELVHKWVWMILYQIGVWIWIALSLNCKCKLRILRQKKSESQDIIVFLQFWVFLTILPFYIYFD